MNVVENWIKAPNMPQEAGDYLWLAQWSCGCCVRKSGICTIFDDGRGDHFKYKAEDGRELGLSWEGSGGEIIGDYPDVEWWLKVDLPPYNDFRDKRLENGPKN